MPKACHWWCLSLAGLFYRIIQAVHRCTPTVNQVARLVSFCLPSQMMYTCSWWRRQTMRDWIILTLYCKTSLEICTNHVAWTSTYQAENGHGGTQMVLSGSQRKKREQPLPCGAPLNRGWAYAEGLCNRVEPRAGAHVSGVFTAFWHHYRKSSGSMSRVRSRSSHDFGTCKENATVQCRLQILQRVWPQDSSKVSTAQRHSLCKYRSHAQT